MTEAIDFTCVIVSWNSAAHLHDCISAIRRSALGSNALLEVIVIDNASMDGSVAAAECAGADRVIVNPINAGFAVGASQGVALAGGAWVMMINPDLIVAATFVSEVAAAVSAVGDDVACLAPDIRFISDSTRVNSRGLTVDDIGIPAEIGKGQLAQDAPCPTGVFGGSGGGSVLRRAALNDVGAFEPAYFAYYEDMDLAWRLQRSGYRALFLSNACASHSGSSTVGVASPLQTYLVARNRRLLFYRHGPNELRARLWRVLIDGAHAGILSCISRSLTPIRGRAAALRLRRYIRFLRKHDVSLLVGVPDALTGRPSLVIALLRKLRSVELES